MASHRGHIICLYGGRAVYVPKASNLQQTLKDAVDCFGLDRNHAFHFGFPHSDLAIMVEISSLAFANVRDGAILYLCTGSIGPVFPHELAEQARDGIAIRTTANHETRLGQGRRPTGNLAVEPAVVEARAIVMEPPKPVARVTRRTAAAAAALASTGRKPNENITQTQPRVKREREEANYISDDYEEDESDDIEDQATLPPPAQLRPEALGPYEYPARAEESYFKRRRVNERTHSHTYEEDYAPHPNRHYIPSRHPVPAHTRMP